MGNVLAKELSQGTRTATTSTPLLVAIFMRRVLTTITLISCVSLLAQSGSNFDQIPNSAMEIDPLGVGESLPATVLFNAEGEQFDLVSAVAAKPTILIFYRGGWCPFCSMQMGQLVKIEEQLRELGYQLIAISPDKPEKIMESMEMWRMKYLLLSDSSMNAALALGIAYRVSSATVAKYSGTRMNLDLNSGQEHHLLPVPAVFIIGKDGNIKFEYINPDYKVRIEPDELLRVARSLVE